MESHGQSPESPEVFEELREARERVRRFPLFHALKGNWLVESHFQYFGHGKKCVCDGLVEGRLIIGGTYLQLSTAADWGEKPYNSLALLSLDPVFKRVQAVWLDNAFHSMLMYTGPSEPEEEGLFVLEGEVGIALDGRARRVSLTIDVRNRERPALSWGIQEDNGDWHTHARSVYTRKEAGSNE